MRRNPWRSKADVARHNKKCAKKAKCRQRWLQVANDVYKKYGEPGAARAIISANMAVKKIKNPTYKTSVAELEEELSRLGPMVIADLVLSGDTRQCGTTASQVVNYLYDKGFIVRQDMGAGVYSSHFDLAVYTDEGWIAVDPTAIQFHGPNSIETAVDIIERKEGIDPDDLSDEELLPLILKYSEPTLRHFVAGLQDGIKAFEITRIDSDIKPVSLPVTDIDGETVLKPKDYGYRRYNSWEEYYKNRLNRLLKTLQGKTRKMDGWSELLEIFIELIELAE